MNEQYLVALDLGSNSFHLIIARQRDGHLQLLDKLRERIQLASGLEQQGVLTQEAMERGYGCLARFAQRLRGLTDYQVRAVGTYSLRKALNAATFVQEAQVILGHPIEIISGREEARLIYLGVMHDVGASAHHRLVVDIGGGSTELVLGKQHQTLQMESCAMGAVIYTQRYFPADKWTKQAWQQAELAAERELQPYRSSLLALGWQECFGASGTITSIGQLLRSNGVGDGSITPSGLDWIMQQICHAGSLQQCRLTGVDGERLAILPGGASILRALMRSLQIKQLHPSQMALREGVLLDLMGREQAGDSRHSTMMQLQQRFEIDQAQAGRVGTAAAAIWQGIGNALNLQGSMYRSMLGWAAMVHELGLLISHGSYHKHGAYVLANADLPGFSRSEQAILAWLVRNHRRKLDLPSISELAEPWRVAALGLCLALRLAVILYRDRQDKAGLTFHLGRDKEHWQLMLPESFPERYPLTYADLEEECAHWQRSGSPLLLATQAITLGT